MPNFLDLPLELREMIYEHYFLSLLLVYPPDQKLFAPRAGLLGTNIVIGFEAARAGHKFIQDMVIEDGLALKVKCEFCMAVEDTMTEEEIRAWEQSAIEDDLKLRRGYAMMYALRNMLRGEREFDDLPLNERH